MRILLTLVPAIIPWDQLNDSGVVPHGVDVHCIAGLIKVSGTIPLFWEQKWFQELPGGLLDALPTGE